MSTNDALRNKDMKKEIEEIIDSYENEFLILGDFNGHIEGLGYQREDKIGRMIKDWIGKFCLQLMNGDEKCEGTITWRRNEQYSAIDMVLVNKDA